MRADKVVVRAILSTLLSIAVLFGFMILALCTLYPSTMMHITYDLGMDDASISNATRAYNRSDEIYYIAFATEVAIGADDHEQIDQCGERFIADERFSAYCEARDAEYGVQGGYEQYIYGRVCMAKYQRGNKTQAIERAFAFVGNAFPKNNAVAAVLLTALAAEDAESVAIIKGKMEEMKANVPEADYSYFEGLLRLCE